MKKVTDMTTGSPFKNIFLFAVPMAIGFMLQELYALGDTLIVSWSRNANAATGINLTGSMNFLIVGFVQGFSAGFGIVLSQFVGARDDKKMRNSVATSLVLSVIIAALMSVISVLAARPVLELLSTDEKYIGYSESYIKVIFGGIIFNMLYNLSDQFLRAMGDSKTPLYILIMCAVLNIGLNSLMFVIPSLTVAWAAWATIISQCISAIVGFTVLFVKFPVLRLKKSDFRFTAKFAGFHLSMGFPMALQFVVTASGCMIAQKAVNDLNDPVLSMAQANASKIDNIFGAILRGAGLAMATYVGQNYGAKRFDRIDEGYKKGFLVGLVYFVISVALYVGLSGPLARLLLPANKIDGDAGTVYRLAFKYNCIQAAFYYPLFCILYARSALQAIGRSGLSVLGGVVEFTMRTTAANTIAVWFGYDGVCFSNPMAWVGGAIFFLIAFPLAFKKLVKSYGGKAVALPDLSTSRPVIAEDKENSEPAEPAPVIRWDEPTVKTGGEEYINEEIETDEKLAAAEDEFPKQ